MEYIKGLNEYVKNEKYRKALNLPNEQEEEYTMLAQGEYNINYSFTHPKTGKKLHASKDREKTSVTCQLWESDASGKSDWV